MAKEQKIHCSDQDDCHYTNCGRVENTVFRVDGWIFDKLKDKHKCLRCKKKEEGR